MTFSADKALSQQVHQPAEQGLFGEIQPQQESGSRDETTNIAVHHDDPKQYEFTYACTD